MTPEEAKTKTEEHLETIEGAINELEEAARNADSIRESLNDAQSELQDIESIVERVSGACDEIQSDISTLTSGRASCVSLYTNMTDVDDAMNGYVESRLEDNIQKLTDWRDELSREYYKVWAIATVAFPMTVEAIGSFSADEAIRTASRQDVRAAVKQAATDNVLVVAHRSATPIPPAVFDKSVLETLSLSMKCAPGVDQRFVGEGQRTGDGKVFIHSNRVDLYFQGTVVKAAFPNPEAPQETLGDTNYGVVETTETASTDGQ